MMKRTCLLIFLFAVFVSFAFMPGLDSSGHQQSQPSSKKTLSPEQQKSMDEHRQLEAKYNIKRGNRPPVDLKNLPESAYEHGVVRIKLKPYMHKSMDIRVMTAETKGYVETGIKEFDDINLKIGAKTYKRTFDDIYDSEEPGDVIKYKERHMAWGFHLIRKIEFDEKTDVLEVVEMFSKLDYVEWAEPFYKKEHYKPIESRGAQLLELLAPSYGGEKNWIPNDPGYDDQYAFPLVNAPDAWEISKGHPDVIVCVKDQGIEWTHPDLAANMWPGIGPQGTSTNIGGDHGCHVGGTVAAVTNNSTGVAGFAGGDGTPDSGIKMQTVNIFGAGAYNTADAYVWAADNGAMMSQNSWGYTNEGAYEQAVLDNIDYFNANGGGTVLQGGIVIFAAGNSNSNGQWYPAYYGYGDPNTLGTMAVASTDAGDRKSGFSNYGPWIDISGPGSDILSTYRTSNGSYGYMSGTSMACPLVMGVASVFVALAEQVDGIILTNEEMWEKLVQSVVSIDDYNPNYVGMLGSGRIDFKKAVDEGYELDPNVLVAPKNFKVEAVGALSIDITWELNDNDDEVLLAYATEENIVGTPIDGQIYSVGQILPDGGEVLYVGSATEFYHADLDPGILYKYRIFSRASAGTSEYDEGDYSIARTGQARTDFGAWELPYLETFEKGIPLYMTMIDNNNDGNNWENILAGFDGENTLCAASYSWVGGSGVNPDNWLITPRLKVFSDQLDLSFWRRSVADFPAEKYTVYVSTTGTDPADFTQIYTETLTAGTSGWVERTVDITAIMGSLAGEEIYIAFRHHDCFDEWILILNNIHVTEGVPADDIYSIEATYGQHGSVDPAGTIKVFKGKDQHFTINPINGFKVSDVLVDGSSVGAVTEYTFENLQADGHTIHAIFEEILWDLTINIDPSAGGSVVKDPDRVQYREGTEVVLSPVENPGYMFSHWSGDYSSDNPCIESIPYTEDFSSNVFTEGCWENQNITGANAWTVNTGTAYWKNAANNNESRAISSPVDLKNYDSATLSFDIRRNGARITGTLRYPTVVVEYWNGANWISIASYTGGDHNNGMFSESIILPKSAFNEEFKIAFRATAPRVNNDIYVRVDNFHVTGTYGLNPDDISVTTDQNRTITAHFELNNLPRPRNLTGNITEAHHVELSWAAPEEPGAKRRSAFENTKDSPILEGYNVYRNGDVLHYIDNPLTLEYTDDTGEPGNSYEYFVTALFSNPEGESLGTEEAFSTGALPVELLTFDAECITDAIEITWTTASEVNNDFFLLERTKNYESWEMVEKVYGQGTTSMPSNYKVIDYREIDGIIYYRLKQQDFDGKNTTYGPIYVNCVHQQGELIIHNVSHNNDLLKVFFSSPFPQVVLEVYDISGSPLLSRQISEAHLHEGYWIVEFLDIQPGVYILRLSNRQEAVVRKFVK